MVGLAPTWRLDGTYGGSPLKPDTVTLAPSASVRHSGDVLDIRNCAVGTLVFGSPNTSPMRSTSVTASATKTRRRRRWSRPTLRAPISPEHRPV